MANRRSTWFTKNSQQGVFTRMSTLPTINRSGAVQIIGENKPIIPPEEKYFVVGKSKVGGKEVVGG